MAEDVVWLVWFFYRCDFIRGELHVNCRDQLRKLVRFRCAYDGRGDAWRLQDPCQRDLRGGASALQSDCGDGVRNGKVIRTVVHIFGEGVGFGALRIASIGTPGAGEEAAGERAPGNDGESLI